jgi:ketosteroid isomerase-like protein
VRPQPAGRALWNVSLCGRRVECPQLMRILLGRELRRIHNIRPISACEDLMNLEHERQRVLQRDAEWAALASAGQDVDGVLAFWTEDAQVFPPGLPVVKGKVALRGYVEGALAIPGFTITWSTSEATLSPDGQLAYLVSANVVTAQSDGRLRTTRGRAMMGCFASVPKAQSRGHRGHQLASPMRGVTSPGWRDARSPSGMSRVPADVVDEAHPSGSRILSPCRYARGGFRPAD